MNTAIARAKPFFAGPARRLRGLATSALFAAATGGAAGALAADAEALRLNPMTPYERSIKQQELNSAQQQNGARQQQDQQYQDALQQSQAQQNGAAAQGRAVLQTWQKRPPLATSQNPLLGRWISQGPAAAAAKNLSRGNQLAGLLGPEMAGMANAMLGGITGGLCDSMLGRGLVEFRPTGVVAIGRDGREQAMYRAEYRGGGSRVVVLPQAGMSFTHMIVDFDSHDHVTVNTVGCVMVRAGSAAAANGARDAAGAAPPATLAAAATPARADAGVLKLAIGIAPSPGNFSPLAGRPMWVMKDSAEFALIRGGVKSSPDATVLQHFALACQSGTPLCQQGLQAIKARSIGVATSDANGHAQTPPLTAGTYYVFAGYTWNRHQMLWNVPVDVKAGATLLTLDQRNATRVD